MVPNVKVKKVDGRTGATKPAATGILGIAAATLQGSHAASAFADDGAVLTEYGYGHMHEIAKYVMAESGKSVVCVGVDGTTDPAYSAITKTGGGTSALTAGVTQPVDEFSVVVDFPVGGTIGVAGIRWRYSLDGGVNFSKSVALGTATSLTIPNTGISLALGAGTITTTTKATFSVTGPKITNADVPTLLEAFRVTASKYEAILIDMDADDTTVGIIATWLLAQNNVGKFPTVLVTSRARNLGTSESEATYLGVINTMLDVAVCVDVVFCADGGYMASAVRGMNMFRPTGVFVAARGMAIPLGQDVAYVRQGPLTSCSITDNRGNPVFHNESIFPGLDDIRATTLCTLPGEEGVFVTNANLLSPSGSDFVYWQHARTMNRGCELAFQVLQKELSGGVRKNPQAGPNGERYIDEAAAQHLEDLGNAPIRRELVLTGQVDDMKLTVSRTDDIRSNSGAKIRVRLDSVSLAYAKEFDVEAGFVTAIPS